MSDSSIIKVRIGGQLGAGLFAIVDAENEELVSGYSWHVNHGYAITSVPNLGGRSRHRPLPMHRLIMGESNNLKIDHINGDKLNNRMSNLRFVSDLQNAQNAAKRRDNTSGFKGVRFHKDTGKWQTSIRSNGVSHYLGIYCTPQEASSVYQAAALIHHGEYARKIV